MFIAGGLTIFQQFYSSQGPIKDFLDHVEQDRLLPRSQRRRVDRLTLNSFVIWLQDRGYTPKTIRIYVGAVQSLAKYLDIPISLRYVQLPPAQPVNSIMELRGMIEADIGWRCIILNFLLCVDWVKGLILLLCK
jgi:hypothetical protein